MIVGEVTQDREAVIRLRLRGSSGQETEVEAVVDTGFTDYMTLSPMLVSALQLPFREAVQFTLADGASATLSVYRAEVFRVDQWRGILVTAAEGGTLVGMSLLYGSRLTLDVIDGGSLTIHPLP